MRAGDETRDVGEDEARLVVDAHDAEVRHEGREREVRHPRPRGGDGADEGRFPGVREPEETRVRQHAQLESKVALGSRRAGLGAPGGLVGRGREVHVAAPAAPAARHHQLLARSAEVAEELAAIGVVDERTGRHTEDQVGAALPVLLFAAPVLAAPRAQRLGVGEVEQGREPGVDGQDDGAAVAAVAAAGAAARHVLLAPEARAAVAPVAGLDPNHDLVHELHRRSRAC